MLKIFDKLGEGSYGKVYKGRYGDNLVAIKILTENVIGFVEIDIMSKLVHPNLVPCLSINKFKIEHEGITRTNLCILMPIAETDLFTYSTKNNCDNKLRTKLLKDVGKGLKFLHDNSILHLDIKISNCLVLCGKGLLADYGMAVYGDNVNLPGDVITESYKDPNLYTSSNYSKKTDIWSYGIVILKIMKGTKYNFSHKDVTTLFNLYSNESEALISLLNTMLVIDLNKRATISEVLSSSFFLEPTSNRITIPLLKPNEYVKKKEIVTYPVTIERYYSYFDIINFGLDLDIETSTFFLAVDLYQRCYCDDFVDLAKTCLFIAISMLEIVKMDDFEKSLTRNSNLEFHVLESLKGVLYVDNLFTVSKSLEKLKLGFECARNAFIYSYIDLENWSDDETDDIPLKFREFYQLVKSSKTIEELFQEDKDSVISS